MSALTPTLTIELDLGEGRRRFFVDHITKPEAESALPRHKELSRELDGLLQALHHGDPEELIAVLAEGPQVSMGETLFRLLFGERKDWQPILRRVWRLPAGDMPHPPRRPLRVRIRERLTEGRPPLTDHLPWRICAFEERTLSLGQAPWTFEVSPHDQPAKKILNLAVPCPVLVIAPEGSAGDLRPSRDPHIEALRTVATNAGVAEKAFRLARTAEETEREAKYHSPRIVYYFGHGEVREGQIGLLLDGTPKDHFVTLADFLRLLSQDKSGPSIVYLNGCRTATGTYQGPARQLLPEIPIAIAQSTTAWSEAMTAQAEGWFRQVLQNGESPVDAIHRLDADESQRGFEWCTTTIATHVDDIIVDRTRARPASPSQRLDRTPQREACAAEAERLLFSEQELQLRCTAIIGFGGPHDGLDVLGEQLLEEVQRRHSSRAAVKRVAVPPLDFPKEFTTQFHDQFALALGEDRPEVPLGPLMNVQVPRPAGKARLLWLDFGIYGRANAPMLSKLQLKSWWVFVADQIARACPADLRVMATVAFCPKDMAKLKHLLDEFGGAVDLNPERFRARVLEPLHYPTVAEVRDSLRLEGCDLAIAFPLAELMLKAAHGSYDTLMALMHEGHDYGWTRLRMRLSGEPVDAPETSERDEEI